MTEPQHRTGFKQIYVLVILSLVLLVNMIDRQIISILIEPIKRDLKVSDTAMGLLAGTAFSVVYVVASIPMAMWIDRGVRRSILAGSVTAWSVLTALCGLSNSFGQLLLARAGVAVAEAGATSNCQSIVSDLFPAHRRATVFGILTAASSVGVGFGLFLGGWINDAFGWRAAFVVVGIPGIALGLLLRFTVAEPPRRTDPQDQPVTGNFAAELASNATLRWLMAASALAGITTYAFFGWGATFLIRLHGLTTAEVGLWLGLATICGQAGGHFLAGFAADRFARAGRHWYALFPGIGTLLAVPFGFAFLFISDTIAVLGAFILFQVLKSSWYAPTFALAFEITPDTMRAKVSALLMFCMTLAGLGLGPLFVGLFNDALAPTLGTEAIRYSLGVMVLMLVPLSAIYIGLARQLAAISVHRTTNATGAPPLGVEA